MRSKFLGCDLKLLVILHLRVYIGACVGLTELVTRYRDDPLRAVTTVPALIYTAANLIASMLALWLLLNVWVDIFPGDDTLPNNVKRVLVAGFGAVAFFRTSIFTLRVNETDLAVGPSLILDTLMDYGGPRG